MQIPRRPFPKSALVAVLLAFFAFFMSALISERVFARLPHLEDEIAYLYQAKTYAGGHLVIPTTEPRRAYWQPFLLDQNGNRFGKYTPGWSMQLMFGVEMGQPWVINAFLAALTVALVYRLGREIFNPDVGVIGAALAAFSPMMLLLDATLMGHTSALFAAMLFLYAYWRIERGRWTLLSGAVAGIGLGLLVANRPITGIAFAAPLILWSTIRLARSVARWFQNNDAEKTRRDLPVVVETSAPLDAPFPRSEASETDLAVMTMEVELRPLRPRRPTLPFARIDSTPVYSFFGTLMPLLILSGFTVLIALIVPLNNYLAVGNPTKDLYTFVWNYDTIGFGECCGRSGHTLEKGIRQARFDLSLTAADLFGWEIGSLTQEDGTLKPEVQNHLLNEGNYWEQFGVSWVLLPFAFLVAYRRKAIFVVIWVAAAYGLVLFALKYQDGKLLTDPVFAWRWIFTALAWLYVPLLFWRDRQRAWTWLLWSAAIGLVIIQMAYWIGSQRYSTRYFYEGLGAIALISALPLAWLARRLDQPLEHIQKWVKVVQRDGRAFSLGDFLALVCAIAIGASFFFLRWGTETGETTGSTGVNLVLSHLNSPAVELQALWLILITFSVGLVSAIRSLLDFRRQSISRHVVFGAGILGLTYYLIFLMQTTRYPEAMTYSVGLGFWVGLVGFIGFMVQDFIPRPAPVTKPVEVTPRWRQEYNRPLVYGGLALALAYSLYAYSTPRISVLTDFNYINGDQIAAVQAQRTGDQPVLVIVNGAAMRWRAMGALMAMTSPYFDSDIVGAWNYEGTNGSVKQQILARFPGRQVIELEAKDNYWWLPGQLPPVDTSTGGGQVPQEQPDTAG